MKNKILMVGPSTELQGGVSTVIRNYKKNIQLFEGNNIKVDFFDSISSNGKLTQILQFIKKLNHFKKIVNKYDIIHIHLASKGSFKRKFILAEIAKEKNIPYIIHLHGAKFDVFFNGSSVSEKNKIKLMFRNAKKIIVLGERWKEKVNLIESDLDILVVNNGVVMKEKEMIDLSEKRVVTFGFLGEIGNRKGTFDLVESFKNVNEKSANLIIAGNGSSDKLKEIITGFNNITYIGWIDKTTKSDFFKKIDVLVLPSYNEGLPMSILEAMSHGKAIISTNVGSIEEAVIDSINGYIIRPGDLTTLSIRMNKLTNDEEKLKSFGDESYKLFHNKFTLETHVEKLLNIYRMTLND